MRTIDIVVGSLIAVCTTQRHTLYQLELWQFGQSSQHIHHIRLREYLVTTLQKISQILDSWRNTCLLYTSPYSVHDPEAFKVDLSQFIGRIPVLGICYGCLLYTSMRQAGIVDPAKVERVALENAASIAGLFLTTECVLVDKPEPADVYKRQAMYSL